MDEYFAECVIQKNICDVVPDHYDFALFHIRLTMIFYCSSRLWRCVLFLVRCFQYLVLTLPMRVAMCCNSKLMEPLLLLLASTVPQFGFTSLTQCMYFPYVFCCFVDYHVHLNKQDTVTVVVFFCFLLHWRLFEAPRPSMNPAICSASSLSRLEL